MTAQACLLFHYKKRIILSQLLSASSRRPNNINRRQQQESYLFLFRHESFPDKRAFSFILCTSKIKTRAEFMNLLSKPTILWWHSHFVSGKLHFRIRGAGIKLIEFKYIFRIEIKSTIAVKTKPFKDYLFDILNGGANPTRLSAPSSMCLCGLAYEWFSGLRVRLLSRTKIMFDRSLGRFGGTDIRKCVYTVIIIKFILQYEWSVADCRKSVGSSLNRSHTSVMWGRTEGEGRVQSARWHRVIGTFGPGR